MNKYESFIVIIFLILGLAVFTVGHEYAHYEIYDKTNSCENISFDMTFTNAKTICTGYTPNEMARELNLWNEIIGYTMAAVLMNFWLMFVLYLLFKK